MVKHILNVPYRSQHLDVEDKDWQSRSCGILCLKMAMDFYYKDDKEIMELIKIGISKGGHSSSGWKHDVLVQMAKDAGLSSFRKEYKEDEGKGVEDIFNFLKNGNPVLVSVVKNFSERDKFHMVLLTGFEDENNKIKGFYYHDPDSIDREEGKHKFVPIETFKKYWRKMAIYVNI